MNQDNQLIVQIMSINASTFMYGIINLERKVKQAIFKINQPTQQISVFY